MSMSMLSTYALTTQESEAMTPPMNIHTLQLNVAMTTLARGPEMKKYNIISLRFYTKASLMLRIHKRVTRLSKR